MQQLSELEKAVDNFLLRWMEVQPTIRRAVDHLRLFDPGLRVASIHDVIRQLEIELEKAKNEKYSTRNG